MIDNHLHLLSTDITIVTKLTTRLYMYELYTYLIINVTKLYDVYRGALTFLLT